MIAPPYRGQAAIFGTDPSPWNVPVSSTAGVAEAGQTCPPPWAPVTEKRDANPRRNFLSEARGLLCQAEEELDEAVRYRDMWYADYWKEVEAHDQAQRDLDTAISMRNRWWGELETERQAHAETERQRSALFIELDSLRGVIGRTVQVNRAFGDLPVDYVIDVNMPPDTVTIRNSNGVTVKIDERSKISG